MPSDFTVGTFARTLTISGYVISEFSRHEGYALCRCGRIDAFGGTVPYLIAITDNDAYAPELCEHITQVAQHEIRIAVFIANAGSTGTISWTDFKDALGGAVPSWRALNESYADDLSVLGSNTLPPNYEGEAWFLFEEGVSDGVEFLIGNRVTRLGGKQRGQDLPDSVALTHDKALLVIDSKASSSPYTVNITNLRPLQEYVKKQKLREQGDSQPAAVLVAKGFKQAPTELTDECNRFLSDTGMPLALLTVASLLEMIDLARKNSMFRNGVSWRRVFCRVGTIDSATLREEFDRVRLVRQANQKA